MAPTQGKKRVDKQQRAAVPAQNMFADLSGDELTLQYHIERFRLDNLMLVEYIEMEAFTYLVRAKYIHDEREHNVKLIKQFLAQDQDPNPPKMFYTELPLDAYHKLIVETLMDSMDMSRDLQALMPRLAEKGLELRDLREIAQVRQALTDRLANIDRQMRVFLDRLSDLQDRYDVHGQLRNNHVRNITMHIQQQSREPSPVQARASPARPQRESALLETEGLGGDEEHQPDTGGEERDGAAQRMDMEAEEGTQPNPRPAPTDHGGKGGVSKKGVKRRLGTSGRVANKKPNTLPTRTPPPTTTLPAPRPVPEHEPEPPAPPPAKSPIRQQQQKPVAVPQKKRVLLPPKNMATVMSVHTNPLLLAAARQVRQPLAQLSQVGRPVKGPNHKEMGNVPRMAMLGHGLITCTEYVDQRRFRLSAMGATGIQARPSTLGANAISRLNALMNRPL